MRARSANQTTQRRGRRIRCSGCGQVPMNPFARAEVTMTWLLVGPDGPVEVHFCRRCTPAGPVDDVACVRCGDGPLLAGELVTGVDGAAAVQGWLEGHGWRLSGPVCPDCVGELAR